MRIRLLAYVAIALLTACGGGDNGTPPDAPLTGRFVDAPVAGLAYRTPTLSGRTDDQGRFRYRPGERVRFTIGDLSLGEARGAAIVTPMELVPDSSIDTPEVLRRVQLLLTLDADGDPDNGIQIPDEAHRSSPALDFGRELADQEGLADYLAALPHAPAIATTDNARDHFSASRLQLYAGDYDGTFSGGQSGTWNLRIATDGTLHGDGYSQQSGPFFISGTIDADGGTEFTGFGGTAQFQGRLALDGTLSGDWSIPGLGETGRFEGGKTTLTPLPPNPEPGTRLTLTGPDAAHLDGRTTPLEGQGGTAAFSIVHFNTPYTGLPTYPFRSDFLIFGIDQTHGIISVTYGSTRINLDDATTPYIYSLECAFVEIRPLACDRIQVDPTRRTITFNGAALPPDDPASGDNQASAPLILSGTLTWEPFTNP